MYISLIKSLPGFLPTLLCNYINIKYRASYFLPPNNISLEHFSRVFAHCHILCLHLDVVSVLFNKITVANLALLRCNFNNKEKVTIIDRLLRTTEASCLHIAGYFDKTNRFNKAFFWMSSVRKVTLPSACLDQIMELVGKSSILFEQVKRDSYDFDFHLYGE
uniref:RUN domain-containing protein n=1 Tax=Heterorhabditis bacteriophora TaxID=37862 RepID=A0A1I7WLP3_HETBA